MSNFVTSDGGNTDPATEFNSTHQSNASPTIAPIENPIPSTNEVSKAIGEHVGLLSPWFYQQWRRVTTLEWTTNDPVGKMLWSADISPLSLDPTLAWQMRLFHAWGGDFEICFRAIATNFHAGQIAVVSFPPRIDPKEHNNPINYTLFPYDVIDVKKLETTEFRLLDRRNTKFHYMRHDERAQLDEDIGGRVGIFVDSPLSTSATGVQKIALAIWVRCAPNFRAEFIRSPLTDIPITTSTVPQTFIDILNATNSFTTLSNGVSHVDVLSIQADTIKILKRHYSNTVDVNGNTVQFLSSNLYPFRALRNPIGFKATSSTEGAPTANGYYQTYVPESCGTMIFFTDNTGNCFKATMSSWNAALLTIKDAALDVGKNYNMVLTNVSDAIETTFPYNNPTIEKAGEGFVLFKSSRNHYCTQTLPLSQLLYSQLLKGTLSSSECYLIAVKSILTKLPLFHMKFHPKGFFTAPATANFQQFSINDIFFEQNGIINALDSFPDVKQGAANIATHLFLVHTQEKLRKKALKASQNVTE